MERALLIAGPTASGKSALALDIAVALETRGGAVIINADSMQVYRELRILTARPSPADEARVPHRLYGIQPIAEPFSVAQWLALARQAIDEAEAAGRLPIVVGGTGLYFRALTEGLADVPSVPTAVRRAARALLAREGPEGLHQRLKARDPAIAARIRPSDPQRLARAWEVLEATGESLAVFQDRPHAKPFAGRLGKVVLDIDRRTLYERCDTRFAAMMEHGALDEVRALATRNLDRDLPAMKALGLPDLLAAVRGETALEEAIRLGQTATRRYAKRQMTWFRNQMISWNWIDAQDSESVKCKIFSIIRDFQLTDSG